MINQEERLAEIWEKYKNKFDGKLKEIVDRGYNFCVNNEPKDILITGFNPSYRENEFPGNTSFSFNETKKSKNKYWIEIHKILEDTEKSLDFSDKTAYTDLFYFRNKRQKDIQKFHRDKQTGIPFLVEQLNLTQHLIEEVIKPKIIIVLNKGSWCYWGKFASKGIIWMGYDLEYQRTYPSGGLYRITGLINSTERIANEIKQTNLKGTLILFSKYLRFTKKHERPNAELLAELLEIQ